VPGVILSKGRVASIRRKFTISFFYLTAYSLIFFGYYKFIVPIFGYSGFEWNPDNAKIIEGIFLSAFIPYILPCRFSKPSDVLLHIQLLFPILPMFVLYGVEGLPREFLYYTLISYLLIVLIASNLRVKSIRITKISPILFQRILLSLSLAVIGFIVLLGGTRYLNLDLSTVYEFRSDAASNLPRIFGYFSPLVSKVMLPFSLLLALINRDKLLMLVSIAGSVMMFGLTAHKGPVFYPFAVLALYFVLGAKNVVRMLLFGYLFILGISLLDFALQGYWIGSLMLRRTFLVPAHLNYLYYDYFSNYSFVLWAQSKITFGIIDSPYNIDTSHLIGSVYLGNELTGANTGWIGSGYMNAGFLGMLLYAVILGLLMAILNAYSKSIDKRIVSAIIIAPMLTVMNSSDLPTALLTHGFFLSLVLFSLFSIRNITLRHKINSAVQ